MSNKPKLTGVPIPASEGEMKVAADSARAQQKHQVQSKMDELWADLKDDERYARMSHLVINNMERSQKCSVQGAELDRNSMLTQRLERILELIAPMGTEARLAFELDWQEMIAVSLGEMEAELRRVELTRNMQPSGLFVPQ